MELFASDRIQNQSMSCRLLHLFPLTSKGVPSVRSVRSAWAGQQRIEAHWSISRRVMLRSTRSLHSIFPPNEAGEAVQVENGMENSLPRGWSTDLSIFPLQAAHQIRFEFAFNLTNGLYLSLCELLFEKLSDHDLRPPISSVCRLRQPAASGMIIIN